MLNFFSLFLYFIGTFLLASQAIAYDFPNRSDESDSFKPAFPK